MAWEPGDSLESIGEPGEGTLAGDTTAGFGAGGDNPFEALGRLQRGDPNLTLDQIALANQMLKHDASMEYNKQQSEPPGVGGAVLDFLTPNTPIGWAGWALAPFTLGGSVPLTAASRALGAVDALVGKDFKNLEGWGDWTSNTWTKADPPFGTPPPDPNKPGAPGGLPPPNRGGSEPGPRSAAPALPSNPLADMPVAAPPQLMGAPPPTVMGTPIGYDPRTAGRTYTNFARTAQRGGLMDLQHQAQNVAAQGRGGDKMLVHMRPDEVAGLQALGGVTRNPQTGMPEHFLGSTLGSLAGLALMPFTGGMINPFVMQGLGAGVGQFAESKMRGEENALQKGLTSGLMAGLGSWGLNKMGAAATAEGLTQTQLPSGQIVPGKEGMVAGAEKLYPSMKGPGGWEEMMKWDQSTPLTGVEGLEMLAGKSEPWMGAAGMGLGSGAVTDMMMPYFPEQETGEFTSTADLTPRYKRTARDLSGEDLTRYGMGPEGRFFSTQRLQGGGLAEVGAMMEEAGPGGDVVAEEVTAQAVSAVRGDHPEPEKAVTAYVEMFGEESFGRLREMVVQEMQVESAGGREEIETEGMISGPGAGRDDLIRGSIEGEEELRVSDGEFIVPADVVSGIGDGSSDAGAKRLYAMLDRVRQTRTGTNKQPGRVNEQEMLPV